jgi:hypothetical protein
MKSHWTDKYTFIRGVVRYKDLAYLVLMDDKLAEEKSPHSVFVERDAGEWGNAGVEKWSTSAVAVCKHPLEQMIAVGEEGDALLYGSGDRHLEKIEDGKISPDNRGFIRALRSIGGKAYAAGMGRQVYRRDAASKWTCIDESMRPPKGSPDNLGFEAIDGFSEKEIYAAGWKGEIWIYDGKTWKQIDSPTNLVLTALCCAGDGHVYATGRRGLLLKGRKNKWQVIKHDSTKQDLWGMAWYNDELYLSSLEQVFVLRKNELEPIVIAEDKPSVSCYNLSAADGVLWSIGPKDVLAFDGKVWTRID